MTTELIEMLRLGASISRERNINLDYARVADEAADELERLEAEAIAASVRMDNDMMEIERLQQQEPACYGVYDPDEKLYEFVAAQPDVCHEHINDAIAEYEIEGAGKWVVRPLYLAAGARL